MHEACDSITFLEGYGHGGTDFFNCIGVVAAYGGRRVNEVDVLPVSGVEGHGYGFDEDVVRAERRDRDVAVN